MHTVDHTKELFFTAALCISYIKTGKPRFFFTVPAMSAITYNDWCNDRQRLPSNETRHLHYSDHYPHTLALCVNNMAIIIMWQITLRFHNTFLQARGPKSTSWAPSVNKPSNKQAMHKLLSPWAIFLTARCETFGSLLVQCSLNRLKRKCNAYCVIAWERAPRLLTVSV